MTAIDTSQKRVQLESGESRGYGALLLATGADPVRLEIAGSPTAHVHYLRSFGDSRAIVASTATAKRRSGRRSGPRHTAIASSR